MLECWLGYPPSSPGRCSVRTRVPVKDLSRSHTPDKRLDTAFHCLRQRAGRSSRTLWNNMVQLLLHGPVTVLRLSHRIWLVIPTRMPTLKPDKFTFHRCFIGEEFRRKCYGFSYKVFYNYYFLRYLCHHPITIAII